MGLGIHGVEVTLLSDRRTSITLLISIDISKSRKLEHQKLNCNDCVQHTAIGWQIQCNDNTLSGQRKMGSVFYVVRETKGGLLSFDTADRLGLIQIFHTIEVDLVKALKCILCVTDSPRSKYTDFILYYIVCRHAGS